MGDGTENERYVNFQSALIWPIVLLGSIALSRTLSTFLYETNPMDPIIYLAVAALMLAVTTSACLAPALRAARFDPMTALRRP